MKGFYKMFIKDILLQKLSPNSFVYKCLRYFYSWWVPKECDISKILEGYANSCPNVFFVQIGSNDGKSGDPIHKYIKGYGWCGILVEPVKSLFEKLTQNYIGIHDRLSFENSAISHTQGQASFYRLKDTTDSSLPLWYDQLGSFDKSVILKHKDQIPNIETMIIEDKVNTITFESLITKHKVKKVNLIHIDTEGFDYQVLKMINFTRHKPDIVLYEHKHLSRKEYKLSVNLMKRNGYSVCLQKGDTICVRRIKCVQ
ncbi:MAG: FkbM family methyltransferase [Fibrobacteres bacterium]|nr:FkbM family methyltransferase [Fibrobacterota bacterium]